LLLLWGLRLLLAGLIAGTLVRPVAAAGTGAPAALPTPDLARVQKQIVVRLANGTAVPGLAVQLAPAALDMGGPPTGTSAQTAPTDHAGSVTFTGLGRWIWMLTVQGRFQGRALQAGAEQGRAPYGRTRGGGGFPVQVEVQEEAAAPTPVFVAGTPRPQVETSVFVLLPIGDRWAPALDLTLPGETPRPVNGMVITGRTTPTPGSTTGPATSASRDISGSPGTLFYGAAGLLGLGAIYQACQRWRSARRRPRRRAPEPLDHGADDR